MSGKIQIVPPAGRYQTPFYFAVYMTGGEAGVEASDHGKMLFSPHSSSPSGFYEGGGTNNRVANNDAIARDCTLLLTVTELQQSVVLAAAQEVPLGKRFQLAKGHYRVSGQLLSFGGHAFAHCEGDYEIVDAMDPTIPPHQRPSGPNGQPLSTSAVYDQLESVKKGGGVPLHRVGSSNRRAAASERQAPVGGQPGDNSPSFVLGAPSSSSSSPLVQMNLESSLRQSEEAIMQAIHNPAAAVLQMQAADGARISRTSSFTSQTAPQSPFSRPPLRTNNSQSSPVQSSNKRQNPVGTVDEEGDTDRLSQHSDSAAGGAVTSALSSSFAIPPPNCVKVGSALLFALPSRDGAAPGEVDVVQLIIQEEVSNKGNHDHTTTPLRGASVARQRHSSANTPPVLLDAQATTVSIPAVARGAWVHWQNLNSTSATAVARLVTRGQSSLSLQVPSNLIASPASDSPQNRHAVVASAAASSVECVSSFDEDSVFSGIQFCIGGSTSGSPLPPFCAGLLVLLSFRAVAPAGDEPVALPYLECEILMNEHGRIRWRQAHLPSNEASFRQQQEEMEDALLFEGVLSTDDTIAVGFISTPLEERRPLNSKRPHLTSFSPPHSHPTTMTLFVNYRAVAFVELPQRPWSISGGENATLRAVVITRALISPAALNASQPFSMLSALREVSLLSHRSRLVDLVHVDLHRSYFMGGDVDGDVGPRALYCWRRGQPLLESAAARLVLLQ